VKRELAVVLLSGGMDSCVTAAVANQRYDMAFLHVKYGQRTEERELKAFNDIADFYRSERKMIADISYLKTIGGSSLTDENQEILPANLKSQEIPSTYVPFRNTHLLSIAVSWAEVISAGKVFIGAVEEDSSGYPDCRRIYFDVFNELIQVGVRPDTRIEVETPLIGMRKGEIVKKGMELNAPLHLSWSCYQGSKLACGVCESCVLRLKGFREAGMKDPIRYREL
jgi:7-cyano-7-deazaguanine synthase